MEVLHIIKTSLHVYDYIHIGLSICVVAGILIWRIMGVNSFYSGYEVFGVDKRSLSLGQAKYEYARNAKKILLDGARKCKTGFQVVSSNGPQLIFPSRYIDELKNVKALTLNGFVKKEFFPHYSGFEANKVTTKSNVIMDTVRIKLTQSLNPVTIVLCEEADAAVEDMYGSSNDWSQYQISRHANDFVARLSTRVFLGPIACRDERWLRIAVDYTIIMMKAARALRMWPVITQPVIHWFLPECNDLRRISGDARKVIEQELARRNGENGIETDSEDGGRQKANKVSDLLGWMQELSNGKKLDLVGGQLALTFAAIHTTSDLLTKSKTSLYQMKLLDSFLKETQRIAPPSIVTMNRVAEDNVRLKDGTMIPKGAYLTVIQDCIFDASIYPEPEKFDGHRFVKLRAQPGQENRWQFVTTSQEHPGFGHGMHACPGRFFASNEVKVALSFLLLRYEWRQNSPKETPRTFEYGSEVIANPQMSISFRRRKEEVDIMRILRQ